MESTESFFTEKSKFSITWLSKFSCYGNVNVDVPNATTLKCFQRKSQKVLNFQRSQLKRLQSYLTSKKRPSGLNRVMKVRGQISFSVTRLTLKIPCSVFMVRVTSLHGLDSGRPRNKSSNKWQERQLEPRSPYDQLDATTDCPRCPHIRKNVTRKKKADENSLSVLIGQFELQYVIYVNVMSYKGPAVIGHSCCGVPANVLSVCLFVCLFLAKLIK